MQHQLAIDVSHWQDPKQIPYGKLREMGYVLCVARATYGTKPDSTFVRHLEKAHAAGMKVGAYHFLVEWQHGRAQRAAFFNQVRLAPVPMSFMAVDVEELSLGTANRARFESGMRDDIRSSLDKVTRTYKNFDFSGPVYSGLYFFHAWMRSYYEVRYMEKWIADYRKYPRGGESYPRFNDSSFPHMWQFAAEPIPGCGYLGPLDQNKVIAPFWSFS